MTQIVIGLVGEAGAGKGEVATPLIQIGFKYYSLSDTLRGVATAVGLSHERENLIALGNVLREKFGSDILAQGARRWIEQTHTERVVIDSIRNPSEVTYLKQELGAFIIGVEMSLEKTFQLMKERGRPGDPTTWEEFLQLKAREQGEGEKASGQQLSQCLALADVILPNEGSLNDLHRETTELLISRGILSEGFDPQKER